MCVIVVYQNQFDELAHKIFSSLYRYDHIARNEVLN